MTNIEAIKLRTSVRTFEEKRLAEEHRSEVESFIRREALRPNREDMRFEVIDIDDEKIQTTKNLSSYGIIKGAKTFIACVLKKDASIIDFGYAVEQIILFAKKLGFGTCWMGGTFSRSAFSEAVGLKKNEILPIVTPIGYPAKNPSTISLVMRYFAKSDKRKPFGELFFDAETMEALAEKKAAEFFEALEMVRIAPSASNKQPWRVVLNKEGDFEFYIKRSNNYGNALGYDIQKMDMGIAMCHFDLAAKERGIKGKFETEKIKASNFIKEKEFEYVATYKRR